jgi:hypothetical protein
MNPYEFSPDITPMYRQVALSVDAWLKENKWLTLSDTFLRNHKEKPNDLQTFTGLCREIDMIWGEIFHNEAWLEKYIINCDLQNLLYTKYVIDALKLRLVKLQQSLHYKREALMGRTTGLTQDDIDRAKNTPILPLIETDLQLRKAGKDYMGKCPLHDEKRPSFSVSVEKNIFYCFSCHTGGGPLDYLIKIKGMEFLAAVRSLL